MIYHVRHPALPSGGGRGRVGCLSPPDRWWNSEDRGCGGGGGGGDGGGGPLGPDVLLHLLPSLTRARWDGSGHLIIASPRLIPSAGETSAASPPGARPGFVRSV